MCGINAIIGYGQETKIYKMNEDLSHRGIRASCYTSPGFSLGHVRLPIQGCSEEYDQPYTYEGLVGAFVGELFNYKKLDVNARTDFPLMMNAFSRNFVPKFSEIFDGFWSAIFADAQFVYVVTDYLAKKPLYIRNCKTYTAISSEIKPLKNLDPVTENKLYFSCVRKWGYTTSCTTPYNEITKVHPNCMIRINILTRETDVLQFPPLKPKGGDFLEILTESIQNRLVSDIPISLLLSGGIDSTIVFELMKKFTKDFTVFHVENDEAEYLNHLDFKGIKLKQITLEETNINEAMYWNETPVDLGSVIPQLALSKAIKKQGLNVAMSGDGADEIFGGYKRSLEYDSQYSDIFEELVYYHLPRLDKLMMANTVELRSPFLSKSVIEFGLSLPYEWRIDKNCLKHMFKNIVPKYILERKKEPLRIKGMRENKTKWRQLCIDTFREREGWNNECE